VTSEAVPERVPAAATEPRHPGVDLAITAIEAAGELAQIGFTITRHFVRATVGRMPRP
jgi:hypothetical protein